MTKAHYPPIVEATLTPFRAIEIQLQSNPGFLDAEECPYPPQIKAMLRRLTGDMSVDTGTGAAQKLVDAGEDALDLEIAEIYLTVKRDMGTYTGSDMKDKMSFLKTAQDLLTKLVDLQARRHNIRNAAKMQRSVVEALEEFLTPAQRTAFISKLEGYLDV